MGVPILTNILDSGDVAMAHVHNRTRSVSDEFAKSTLEAVRGKIMLHDSPADALAATQSAASAGRIIVSIVSNDAALRAVCDSLTPGLRAGDVHLCLSTVSPSIADAEEARCSDRQAFFISCPVFGRPPVAEARKLIVVPSGDAAAIERITPLLHCFSQKIVVGGAKASNSNILKLCGNFCILSFIQMHAEAFALAESHGIPRATAYDLLSSADGVFSRIPILAVYGQIVQAHEYQHVGFTAENGLKDATLVCAAAKDVAGAAIMHVVQQRLARLCREDPDGGRSLDWSGFAKYVHAAKACTTPPPAVDVRSSSSGTTIGTYIDHTVLKPTCIADDIRQVVAEALLHRFAAVCIPPHMVALARSLLDAEGGPKISTVVGFPFGYSCSAAKVAEIQQAIADGADEIDLVANISHIKAHQWVLLADEIKTIMPCIRSANKIIKVIIESGLLSDEEIIHCCQVYNTAGIDFLKTSTGYAEGGKGATIEHVQLFRSHLLPEIHIKASGGIRDYNAAAAMIAAGATRIGTSSSVLIVRGALPDTTGGAGTY